MGLADLELPWAPDCSGFPIHSVMTCTVANSYHQEKVRHSTANTETSSSSSLITFPPWPKLLIWWVARHPQWPSKSLNTELKELYKRTLKKMLLICLLPNNFNRKIFSPYHTNPRFLLPQSAVSNCALPVQFTQDSHPANQLAYTV